jgi:hypothetical protein
MATWQNVPGNQLLDSLKEVGMGIRRTDFLGIRREVLGIVKYQEQLEKLPGESLVPKAYMQDRSDLRMTNNMQYRFSVLGYDPETEERTIHTRAVSSNHWMTKDEAQEFIEGLYMFPTENSNYIVEDILISEVWVNDMNRLS